MDLYDYAEARHLSTRQVLDFTTLTNPLGPSNKAKYAMRKALKDVHLHPDRQTRYLRRFIARNEHAAPERIVFGQGSTQILDLLLSFLRPGKLLVPTPLPAGYEGLITRHGARLIPFPLRKARLFSLDTSELAARLDEADMVLIPTPHPATGTVVALDALHELIGRLEGLNKTLVIDEGLAGFGKMDSPVEKALRSDHVLIVRTFSLFHALAGLRLGYALGGKGPCDLMTGVIDRGGASTVAAAGALASLRDRGFARRTEEFLRAEKVYMTGKLGRVKAIRVIERECNFLLVDFLKPVADLQERFLQRNILIDVFEDEEAGAYIRLPMRKHRENARFARALGRIAAEEGQ
ncbi:MAG: aminotransferase class I/II-fold pyridoxal phosphate-dependent enzyme [Syntrophorhabdales bacterium]|jgi:histidinol-phosphate/aromatic aminotransferase/cobyric acid decarboxylase-like protein